MKYHITENMIINPNGILAAAWFAEQKKMMIFGESSIFGHIAMVREGGKLMMRLTNDSVARPVRSSLTKSHLDWLERRILSLLGRESEGSRFFELLQEERLVSVYHLSGSEWRRFAIGYLTDSLGFDHGLKKALADLVPPLKTILKEKNGLSDNRNTGRWQLAGQSFHMNRHSGNMHFYAGKVDGIYQVITCVIDWNAQSKEDWREDISSRMLEYMEDSTTLNYGETLLDALVRMLNDTSSKAIRRMLGNPEVICRSLADNLSIIMLPRKITCEELTRRLNTTV